MHMKIFYGLVQNTADKNKLSVELQMQYIRLCFLFSSTLADGELGGFFIPKGSYLMCNLWAIHYDFDYWGKDAEKFRPQRFLSDDGKTVKKLEHLMPFSIGKFLN